MVIKKLTLDNFRNYEHEDFVFDGGLNILTGKNAQGKTNCAEAVFYLCTGASLRIRHDKQLIRKGAEFARICAVTESRFGTVSLEAVIYENKRDLYLNGNKIRPVDFLGNMNSVFFSPGELRLIQDGPDERRRFLNLSISQTSRDYRVALSRYQRVLEQRNNLLKSHGYAPDYDALDVWDEQLAGYAARIVKRRREFLAQLGFTTVGPHRDDLRVTLNGQDARGYASQGQARTAALAMKLAETQIFRSVAGEAPILILDDVMSELDLPRRKRLLAEVKDLQCILTCTHAERVLYGKESLRIRIHAGKIVE